MKNGNIEREKKFLLKRNPKKLSQYPHKTIEQGYLVRSPENIEIRLRKKGKDRLLTVKKSQKDGRLEKEIPISAGDFKALWPLTKGKRLKKIRYSIPYRNHEIELDVYQGRLRGLKTAEVEFGSKAARKKFTPPDWFEKEITGNHLYSNWKLATSGLPKGRRK